MFKKNNEEYNYSNIIKKYYDNEDKLNRLYLTNNIIESLRSKLDYYLPKQVTNIVTNIYNFINRKRKFEL